MDCTTVDSSQLKLSCAVCVCVCVCVCVLLQSKEEEEGLKRYTATYGQPEIYSDPAKIDSLIDQIETALQRTFIQ